MSKLAHETKRCLLCLALSTLKIAGAGCVLLIGGTWPRLAEEAAASVRPSVDMASTYGWRSIHASKRPSVGLKLKLLS